MKYKILVLSLLSSISITAYADKCLTADEVDTAIITDTLVKPTGECSKTKPAKLDVNSAFINSKEIVSYNTNSLVEGMAGLSEGVFTQVANTIDVINNDTATAITDKIESNKQIIQQDTEESTAYKTGMAIGTVTVIGLGYMVAKRGAKKDMDDAVKPLQESNKRLEESNKRLESELKQMKNLKLEQYKLIEAQRVNTAKATEQSLTTKPYTPFVP